MIRYLINLLFLFLPPSPDSLSGFKRWILRKAGCKVGKNVRVMRLKVQGCNITIGEKTFIGDECCFSGSISSHVNIGALCDISSQVCFITGTHVLNERDNPKAAGSGYGKDIIVGNGVWIGYGAKILPGVKIGDGAMIAAGAVVCSDVPAKEVWGGVPAKYIKIR